MNENQKATTEEYKENYDQIDWSDSTAEPPTVLSNGTHKVFRYGPEVDKLERQHGIPCIRSDKPHHSSNAAIHTDQVASFNKKVVKGCHYEPGTGVLVSTSSAAREREARRRGLSYN